MWNSVNQIFRREILLGNRNKLKFRSRVLHKSCSFSIWSFPLLNISTFKGGNYIGDGDPDQKLSCRHKPRFSPFSPEPRFSPACKACSDSCPHKAECCKLQTCWLTAGIQMTAGCWTFMQARPQIRQAPPSLNCNPPTYYAPQILIMALQ